MSLLVALIVGLLADPAESRWRRNEDIVTNSAYTLAAGEFMVGVFTPLQYGLTDSLSLVMHPVFQLVLTPNVGLRFNLIDGPVAVTLAGSYLQSFLTELPAADGGGFPGSGEAAAILSGNLTPHLTLTGFVGYTVDFATRTRQEEILTSPPGAVADADFATRRTSSAVRTGTTGQGLLYGAGLNWRITPSHLLALQYRAVVRTDTGEHETPTALALYAHAWARTRVGVGVAAGRFLFRTGEQRLVTLPVYPVLDLWFRL